MDDEDFGDDTSRHIAEELGSMYFYRPARPTRCERRSHQGMNATAKWMEGQHSTAGIIAGEDGPELVAQLSTY